MLGSFLAMLPVGGKLRRFCLTVVLVISTVAIAWAQDIDQEGRNEVAGTVGRTFISDQGVPNSGLANSIINHGTGFSFEVNYARILRGSDWADLALEVPVIVDPDEDLHYFSNQIPQQYSSLFVTPAARVRLFPDVA